MITISEQAVQELERFFEGKERTAVRIYKTQVGCDGASLALSSENPAENDVTYEVGGFTFCIDKGLEASVGDVDISVMFTGFIVTPSIPLPAERNCIGCAGICGHPQDPFSA